MDSRGAGPVLFNVLGLPMHQVQPFILTLLCSLIIRKGVLLGSNLMHNTRSQGELASNGQVHLASNPYFPQRPDQPECRYYMKSGTCKYGAECKYHHPKERIPESASNLIGPSFKTWATCMFKIPHDQSSTLSYPHSWIAQRFESSPSSVSPKFPDQGQKTENENYKNSESKAPEESPEQAADSLPPSPSSSETLQDRSGLRT